MKSKWYVTISVNGSGKYWAFKSKTKPTEQTHGMQTAHKFGAVIGPFRTKRAAIAMQVCGQGNPHMQTVAETERIAARWAKEGCFDKQGNFRPDAQLSAHA